MKQPTVDVVCLGILVADIFARPIDALPGEGELKLTDGFLLGVGGCAANTAVCLRRLGKTARLAGKLGSDLLGDYVVTELARLGIDTSCVVRCPTRQTSATMIINVGGQDRRYIHSFGANAEFSLSDVDLSILDGARILYVGGYLAMPAFGAVQLEQLFRCARQRSLQTVLDVVIPARASVSMQQLEAILQFTDVFLPNEDETRTLTARAVTLEQLEVLSALNPACTVVITQGRKGAWLRRGRECLRANAFQVKTVDESGAGDAFDAGFLVGLLEGWSLEQTLVFASAVGASCATALGCTSGVFNLDQTLAFIAENPLEVTRTTL